MRLTMRADHQRWIGMRLGCFLLKVLDQESDRGMVARLKIRIENVHLLQCLQTLLRLLVPRRLSLLLLEMVNEILPQGLERILIVERGARLVRWKGLFEIGMRECQDYRLLELQGCGVVCGVRVVENCLGLGPW